MKIRRSLASAMAAFTMSALALEIAPAQGTGNNKDAAEMKAYRLTMDGIRKLSAAGEAMMKAMEADPRYKAEQALKKEIAALEKKDELSPAEEKKLEDLRAKLDEQESNDDSDSSDNNAQSLDDMARRIESVPEMAKAIRGAGLTPREYSLMSLVTFQAMMVHGFQKAAGSKELPPEMTATVLADNIKFVRDNEAEITRLLERLTPPGKKH
jgi:predicted phage tail protein